MPHIHELYDFTASAFVIHPTDPKLLLLKHKKIGKWLQPGGHIELNEDPIQALHHELEEEAGLKPEDYEIVEPSDQPQVDYKHEKTLPLPFHFNLHSFKEGESHQHIDICYLVKAKTDEITDNPDGAESIDWFTRDEILALYEKGEILDPTFDICEWIFERKLNTTTR